MTDEQYKRLEERLDRIEAKVDVASDLIATRLVSAIGGRHRRRWLEQGRTLLVELWEERGIKL